MLILNGDLALPGAAATVRGSIRILDGKIRDIGPELEPLPDEELVNATGLMVLPGGVDSNVHFTLAGSLDGDEFLRGTAEAARGGTTTIIDMPCSPLLSVLDLDSFNSKLDAVASQAVLDYGFFGGLRGSNIQVDDKLMDLSDKVLGYKAYLISIAESLPRLSHGELEKALHFAQGLKRPLLLHAEDDDYVSHATARIKAARGETPATWEDYADSRPEMSEIVACAVALALAGGHEKTLHVVNVATAQAADNLWLAGASCETCTHYLAFSREDYADKGALLKTAPSIKKRVQSDRLWAQLAESRVAFVSSDHIPGTMDNKSDGSVWMDRGGISGVGFRLPYLFSEGYLAGRLSLDRFLDVAAAAAARRFGLDDRKGTIELGKDADLVLMDPRATQVINVDRMYTKERKTPFVGMTLKGAVRSTWVRGRLVYDALEDAAGRSNSIFKTAARRRSGSPLAEALREFAPGILAEPGYGRFLTWKKELSSGE